MFENAGNMVSKQNIETVHNAICEGGGVRVCIDAPLVSSQSSLSKETDRGSAEMVQENPTDTPSIHAEATRKNPHLL